MAGIRSGYKVRHYENGRKKADGTSYMNYSLTVPVEIAESLPKDITFIPKMTDEGLLYCPVSQYDAKQDLPEWAKPEPPKKPRKAHVQAA
jgi:hypothetical protein